MEKTGNGNSMRKRLKNIKAQLMRREDKIVRLEAKIAQMEEEAKKKASTKTADPVLQSFAKESQGISSRNLLLDMQLHSDAKQTAALEILLRLLKD